MNGSSVQAEELSFFKDDYTQARTLFLKQVQDLKKEVPTLQHHELSIPSATQKNLITDSLYIPPSSGMKERLVVLISGTHGIEAFVGSALQSLFIHEKFWQQRDDKLGILIIHGLNPYGFQTGRRVSENNVDLNRNFDTSSDLFQLKNPGYQKVQSLLNPSEKAVSGGWDRIHFYFQCVKAIAQHSMDSLRRAILKGQYEAPAGVYFGGQNFEPQKEILEKELLTFGAGFKDILLIDLHTGYGENGKLHLFADRHPALDSTYTEKIFAGQKLDYAQKKDFYEVTGGLVVYAAKLFQNKARYAGMVFEIGTLDSQKTLGSLDSLYRLVRENQLHIHGAQNSDEDQAIREQFREMFYPSSPQWREGAVKQFREVLSAALKNQKALN